jgi:hypothetical protein
MSRNQSGLEFAKKRVEPRDIALDDLRCAGGTVMIRRAWISEDLESLVSGSKTMVPVRLAVVVVDGTLDPQFRWAS